MLAIGEMWTGRGKLKAEGEQESTEEDLWTAEVTSDDY